MGKQIEIYVPSVPVTIFCHSKILDEMDRFTQFIIWSVGNGYTEQQIQDTVQLDNSIIRTALADLENWKFAVHSTQSAGGLWELTESGSEYFALICCMEKLENRGFNGCMELYSGEIEIDTSSEVLVERKDIPEGAICLESGVMPLLFGNDNYSNSQQLAKEKLCREKLLEEKYMNSIYTTIRVCQGESYRKYVMPEYDLMKCSGPVNRNVGDIKVGIPVAKYSYQIKYSALDPYRSVLDTLKNLKVYEQCIPTGLKFLTEEAKEITETYEQELQLPAVEQYVDEYAGKDIKSVDHGRLLLRDELAKRKIQLLPVAQYTVKISESEYRYEQMDTDMRYAAIVSTDFKKLYPADRGRS